MKAADKSEGREVQLLGNKVQAEEESRRTNEEMNKRMNKG